MATLNLTKAWINLVATGQAVSAYMDPGRAEDYQVAGKFQTFAGGRRRLITAAGEEGLYKVPLVDVPRATVDTLIVWQRQLVQVRDNVGRRFFGAYLSVAAAEIRGLTTYTVEFTLTVVTADEGV